uniref:2,3-dihydroxybiphenyl dioxygenase n=1 Tax=uncultured bacterium UPO45 TaxID=1776970 RepID=A0A126SY49_9BACT|nr:2,3-dihydroxybiphenyl dioxygenase [uncultured bacterium UPO45]
MASIAQLGYLGLGVRDVNEWERFASNVLGLQPNGRDPDGSLFLRMDEYHHRFIVHPNGNDDLAYIGWEVTTEQAMAAMAEQLRQAGVEVRPGTAAEADARRVAGLIKFADPSGLPSEIFYGPLVTFDKPFQSPRPISGFKTEGQGLGHFVVAVDDFDRSLAFYRDVLGMRISDFVNLSPAPNMQLKVAFFHCNPRHHTLAFWAMPQSPKRLHHFMLQLNSLDDVGSTYYLCQNQQTPITMNLGKHTNDHMVSFYLRTPSGFAVEYGWGAREVDDATWQVQVHTAGSIWGHQGSL